VVFLLRVLPLGTGEGSAPRQWDGNKGRDTYAFARWLMKTLALLVMARMALAWICVLGGSTPLARRVIIDLGSVRSCGPRARQHNGARPYGAAERARTSIVTGPPSRSLSLSLSLSLSFSFSFLSVDAGRPGAAADRPEAVDKAEACCGSAGGARALAAGVAGPGASSAGAKCACDTSLLRGDMAHHGGEAATLAKRRLIWSIDGFETALELSRAEGSWESRSGVGVES